MEEEQQQRNGKKKKKVAVKPKSAGGGRHFRTAEKYNFRTDLSPKERVSAWRALDRSAQDKVISDYHAAHEREGAGRPLHAPPGWLADDPEENTLDAWKVSNAMFMPTPPIR